jgi:hypothetical protein
MIFFLIRLSYCAIMLAFWDSGPDDPFILTIRSHVEIRVRGNTEAGTAGGKSSYGRNTVSFYCGGPPGYGTDVFRVTARPTWTGRTCYKFVGGPWSR